MWCCGKREPDGHGEHLDDGGGSLVVEQPDSRPSDECCEWSLNVRSGIDGSLVRQKVRIGRLLHGGNGSEEENDAREGWSGKPETSVHAGVLVRPATLGGQTEVALIRGPPQVLGERIRIARRLGAGHPNLVRFFGCPTHPSITDPAALFELAPGGTLASHLRHHGDLPVKDCFRILGQIAAALEYLAQNATPHRAVCASAVLLVSTHTARLTMPKSVVHPHDFFKDGRPLRMVRWMAPEVLKYGAFSAAADVWSFGTLCHETFTRAALPFTGFSNTEAYDQIDAGIPVSLGALRQHAPFIATRCFNYEPDRRPTAATLHVAFTAALEQSDSDEDTVGCESPFRGHCDSVSTLSHKHDTPLQSAIEGDGLPTMLHLLDGLADDNDVFADTSETLEGGGASVAAKLRVLPIAREQLVSFAVRISNAIDSLGKPHSGPATATLETPAVSTGEIVRLSPSETQAFQTKSAVWEPGRVIGVADCPAELWTPRSLTDLVALAAVRAGGHLVAAAQTSDPTEQHTAVARWLFANLQMGLPQSLPLHVGDACGYVTHSTDGGGGSLHSFCEPIRSADGSLGVAFGVTCEAIGFGAVGTCRKVVRFEHGDILIRNELEAEITLGAAAGFERYSVGFPDAVYSGMASGNVRCDLVGSAQIACLASRLALHFGGSECGVGVVHGSLTLDGGETVATIAGASHTTATLLFRAVGHDHEISLNIAHTLSAPPVSYSVATANDWQQRWRAAVQSLRETRQNGVAEDGAAAEVRTLAAAYTTNGLEGKSLLFASNESGCISVGLSGHTPRSALRRYSVDRNDLYPFEDSEARVQNAILRVRRRLVRTVRLSSRSFHPRSSEHHSTVTATIAPGTPRAVRTRATPMPRVIISSV